MWRCGLVMLWVFSVGQGGLPAEERVAGAYDPLAKIHSAKVVPLDLTIRDEARSRDIPIRVYRCGEIQSAPVLLFSHGLGGSREMGLYLGEHWAARGYIAVFLQHPGSDTSVWKGKRPVQIMAAMKEAANAENFLLRAKDVPAVLDQLERWNKDAKHPLFGAFNLEQVGMAGHSFGAVTTQAVSGQSAARGNFNLTDPRIKAALPMSPSSPAVGDPASAFGKVSLPWLLMTGTQDVSAIGGATVETRRAVYTALPPCGKYELVLDEAEHSVFTDRELPGDKHKRNPNHHRVILAVSTAFWDAYLKQEEPAKSWLDGQGPRTVMETKELWQRK